MTYGTKSAPGVKFEFDEYVVDRASSASFSESQGSPFGAVSKLMAPGVIVPMVAAGAIASYGFDAAGPAVRPVTSVLVTASTETPAAGQWASAPAEITASDVDLLKRLMALPPSSDGVRLDFSGA